MAALLLIPYRGEDQTSGGLYSCVGEVGCWLSVVHPHQLGLAGVRLDGQMVGSEDCDL